MDINTELMLDVGQANELKLAVRRCGGTNADLKKLSEGDMFARILPVIRGLAEVNIVKHLIDLDANPFTPNNWTVEEHRQGGQFIYDPTKVRLYLSPNQQGGKCIQGHNLRKELVSQPVFNANLLDYYMEHKELIPAEWKKDENGNTRYIFFWGTIYRSSAGELYVRCLYWNGGQWRWHYLYLVSGWSVYSPSLLRAS